MELKSPGGSAVGAGGNGLQQKNPPTSVQSIREHIASCKWKAQLGMDFRECLIQSC